jgi:hypothetical protein
MHLENRSKKHTLVDVGQDTTLGDGDVTQELVQFLIVADGELQMTGDDTGLLVVTSGVASQLEDFGSEVLKDGSQVDGSTGTDTLSVVALSQETVDTADRECETRLGGSGLSALGARGLAARFAASHFD